MFWGLHEAFNIVLGIAFAQSPTFFDISIGKLEEIVNKVKEELDGPTLWKSLFYNSYVQMMFAQLCNSKIHELSCGYLIHSSHQLFSIE